MMPMFLPTIFRQPGHEPRLVSLKEPHASAIHPRGRYNRHAVVAPIAEDVTPIHRGIEHVAGREPIATTGASVVA